MPKLEKSTDQGHKLISSEDGHDTSACKISGHSLHAFSGKCPETSPDGRTCRKTVTVSRVDQRTHVQVKRGYFRLRREDRPVGQPENIMPPAPKGGGIKNKQKKQTKKKQQKTWQGARIAAPRMAAGRNALLCTGFLIWFVCCSSRRTNITHILQGYSYTSNIRSTWEGNKIVDHSDVVGASPVGAALPTSSFST